MCFVFGFVEEFRSRYDALFLCTTTAWFHHLPRFFWFDGNTGHMNLAFVRIWSETCPSDCEGTVCRATRTCADFLYTALCFNGVPLDLFWCLPVAELCPPDPRL